MGDEGKNSEEKTVKVRIELIDKMATLITAAFGLVAALAWNSAIQNAFSHFFGDTSSLTAQLIYAVVVTVMAVYITFLIGRAKASLIHKLDKK